MYKWRQGSATSADDNFAHSSETGYKKTQQKGMITEADGMVSMISRQTSLFAKFSLKLIFLIFCKITSVLFFVFSSLELHDP